jgi:DNA-binding FadR family transcriptional regulator
VSRTVVREAVAALRAEGLVITRQGVGAFVSAEPQRAPFRIEPERMQSLRRHPHVMELRLGVEIESAGLAAERASKAQLRASAQRSNAIEAPARGRLGGRRGPRFPSRHRRSDRQSGVRALPAVHRPPPDPRRTVSGLTERMGGQRAYLALIQEEHRSICDAIAAAIPSARARPCAATSRARSSATASSPPRRQESRLKILLTHIRRKRCELITAPRALAALQQAGEVRLHKEDRPWKAKR